MPAPTGPAMVRLQRGAHRKPSIAVELCESITEEALQRPQTATAINQPHAAGREPARKRIADIAIGATFQSSTNSTKAEGACEKT